MTKPAAIALLVALMTAPTPETVIATTGGNVSILWCGCGEWSIVKAGTVLARGMMPAVLPTLVALPAVAHA